MRMTWQKKIVGRSEKELSEALEHSERVLDEELEGGGWKLNMDKREVVPKMKGKRLGFDLTGWRGRATQADVLRGMATIVRNYSAETERHEQRGCPWADFGRVWAKKRIIFGCKVLGAAVAAAETCAWHDSEMQLGSGRVSGSTSTGGFRLYRWRWQ